MTRDTLGKKAGQESCIYHTFILTLNLHKPGMTRNFFTRFASSAGRQSEEPGHVALGALARVVPEGVPERAIRVAL